MKPIAQYLLISVVVTGLVANLLWSAFVRLPFGGKQFVYQCAVSPVRLVWVPSRSRGYMFFEGEYFTPHHIWRLESPSTAAPWTWLDRLVFGVPNPDDVFSLQSASVIVVADTATDGMLSAYLLEPEPYSQVAWRVICTQHAESGAQLLSRAREIRTLATDVDQDMVSARIRVLELTYGGARIETPSLNAAREVFHTK